MFNHIATKILLSTLTISLSSIAMQEKPKKDASIETLAIAIQTAMNTKPSTILAGAGENHEEAAAIQIVQPEDKDKTTLIEGGIYIQQHEAVKRVNPRIPGLPDSQYQPWHTYANRTANAQQKQKAQE